MSTNNEADNSKDDSDNESDNIPSQPEFNGSSGVPTQQNNGSNEVEHTREVNNWKEYGWKWIEPLNLVTIALAVFTAMLFWQASTDSQTAEKAAKAA